MLGEAVTMGIHDDRCYVELQRLHTAGKDWQVGSAHVQDPTPRPPPPPSEPLRPAPPRPGDGASQGPARLG